MNSSLFVFRDKVSLFVVVIMFVVLMVFNLFECVLPVVLIPVLFLCS